MRPMVRGQGAGLLRADGKIMYAIRDGIPVLLIDEGILVSDPIK